MVQPISKPSRVTRKQSKLSFVIYADMKQIWGKGYDTQQKEQEKIQHGKAMQLQA
jgi:hypothetical protein